MPVIFNKSNCKTCGDLITKTNGVLNGTRVRPNCIHCNTKHGNTVDILIDLIEYLKRHNQKIA
jgi:hypothetical protein